MPEGGQGPAVDQRGHDAVAAGDAGLLRGDRHGDHVPAAELDELAGQGRIGRDDVGGVLGAAALHRYERPLEVDAGELARVAQIGQDARARPQDVGGRGDAGGHQAGGAVTAVLQDGDHGLIRSLGIGEGLPAAAVAVDVDEAGQQVAALGGDHGVDEQVAPAGALGLGGGPHPCDVPLGDDDQAVLDNLDGSDDSPAQGRGNAAHARSVTPDV